MRGRHRETGSLVQPFVAAVGESRGFDRMGSAGTLAPDAGEVIGLEEGQVTDAHAGVTARFFMAGRSDYTIRFGRR